MDKRPIKGSENVKLPTRFSAKQARLLDPPKVQVFRLAYGDPVFRLIEDQTVAKGVLLGSLFLGSVAAASLVSLDVESNVCEMPLAIVVGWSPPLQRGWGPPFLYQDGGMTYGHS